jgi:hypothetical protein
VEEVMMDRTLKILALVAMAASGVARQGLVYASQEEGRPVGTGIPQAGNALNSVFLEGIPEPTPVGSPTVDENGVAAYPAIKAALSENVAEFTSPTQEPPELVDVADVRSIEAPPSGLSRAPVPKLPAYTVLGSRVFVFSDRDLYTKFGMVEQSLRAHPGLHVGNVFNLNASVAYEMFLQDDWRRTKGDYWDMAHAMTLGGDRGEGRLILKAVDDEDVEMRGKSDEDGGALVSDRFRVGQLQSDSKLLEGPEKPIDVPVVQIQW